MTKDDHRQGFISLHRSILDWEWYGDANTCRLFIHLLLTVEFHDRRICGKTVKRGQRLCSVQKLSEEIGLTNRQTRTALEHLKTTGEVTSRTSPQGTVITVKNYAEYQKPTNDMADERQTSDKPNGKRATNRRQTTDKPSLFNNNKNKERGNAPSAPALSKQKFNPPTAEQVAAYCGEKGYHIDPEAFVAFYECKGWAVGKNKMKNWKAAVLTWEKRERAAGKGQEDYSDVL